MNYKDLQLRRNFLAISRDGIDAVINYVDSSTNQKLQGYYEHLRTARDIYHVVSDYFGLIPGFSGPLQLIFTLPITVLVINTIHSSL
jgi:hypothetical protein